MHLSDMHFHLDGYQNHQQIYNQINSLEQYTLCVTNSSMIFRACKSTYKETAYIKFALGSHPLDKTPLDINDFMMLSRETKYIGEVGLDFSKASIINQEKQKQRFEDILHGVGDVGKIFSIHSNAAEKEVLFAIKEFTKRNKYIFHWFNGDEKVLHELLDIGCYFSLNIGQIKSNIDLIKMIPLNRILIETDAPKASYLNGKFSPIKLKEIYHRFSDTLKIDAEFQISNNLKTLLTL